MVNIKPGPFKGGLIQKENSIFRYYPEGGWGWVVLICAGLSQAIAHGLQLGAFPYPMAEKARGKFADVSGIQIGKFVIKFQ